MSMANDYLKHNEAIRLGWRLLYFMGHDIKDDSIKKTIDYVIDTMNKQPVKELHAPVSAVELFRKLHEGRNKHGS